MPAAWERSLDRWVKATLIDRVTAERIHAFEAEHARAQGLRWPVLLALAFGGIALGAGVLLFVAAHWDDLSPAARFSVVLLMVAVFHVGGAFTAGRFQGLATTLHALGTVALGAGIFLAGQIFNLQEHWPGGLMLWALGAWLGWGLLKDWPQAALAALLTPLWLAGEWAVATDDLGRAPAGRILFSGILLLTISYLTVRTKENGGLVRRTLAIIGVLALIPSTLAVVGESTGPPWRGKIELTTGFQVLGWLAAYGLPMLVAFAFRRRDAWMNVVAAVWVWGLSAVSQFSDTGTIWDYARHELGPYAVCVIGSLGLVVWGLKEARRERINLGVAGFALTVLIFYFSTVMDKLGRSVSLIGLGVIFIYGGWALERLRRRLVSQVRRA